MNNNAEKRGMKRKERDEDEQAVQAQAMTAEQLVASMGGVSAFKQEMNKTTVKRPTSMKKQQQQFVKSSTTLNTPATTTTISQQGSNVKNVANHYDSRKDQGLEKRQESVTLKIRNFNNWLKSVLIHLYVKANDSVLDLCCGKGGDLNKFAISNIRYYVGADVAGESVKDATRRYSKMRNCHFRAKFVHADLTRKTLSQALNANERFDAVSCQFALHYSFESEAQAKKMLQNASDRLKDNGFLIVTIPDAYVMIKKLRTVAKDKAFGNKFYNIVFDNDKFSASQGPYGHRYVFSLLDAVDNCPEYVVHPRHFVQLAKQFKLSIEEELNFHEFFDKYHQRPEFKKLLERNVVNDGPLTAEEWDAVYIYRVFVFKKMASDTGKPAMEAYNPTSTVPTGFHPINESEIIHL